MTFGKHHLPAAAMLLAAPTPCSTRLQQQQAPGVNQEAAVAAVASQLHQACKDVGFFYISNHGERGGCWRGRWCCCASGNCV